VCDQNDDMKGYRMGRMCSTPGEDVKCLRNCSRKGGDHVRNPGLVKGLKIDVESAVSGQRRLRPSRKDFCCLRLCQSDRSSVHEEERESGARARSAVSAVRSKQLSGHHACC
jgi:hypothetical protein